QVNTESRQHWISSDDGWGHQRLHRRIRLVDVHRAMPRIYEPAEPGTIADQFAQPPLQAGQTIRRGTQLHHEVRAERHEPLALLAADCLPALASPPGGLWPPQG